jgi:glutamate synthase domain-containing protein 3
MVDLEPLDLAEDVEFVRTMILRHTEYTHSPKAQWVLDNWDSMLPKFIKVFPKDLKRALREQRERAAVQA